jgi:hypothetical protein
MIDSEFDLVSWMLFGDWQFSVLRKIGKDQVLFRQTILLGRYAFWCDRDDLRMLTRDDKDFKYHPKKNVWLSGHELNPNPPPNKL